MVVDTLHEMDTIRQLKTEFCKKVQLCTNIKRKMEHMEAQLHQFGNMQQNTFSILRREAHQVPFLKFRQRDLIQSWTERKRNENY